VTTDPDPRSSDELPLIVRRASLEDVDVLVSLMREFYAEAGLELRPEAAGGAFRTVLSEPRVGSVFLALRGDRPIGYVVLTLGFSMEFGGIRGQVDDFFVLAAERGRGVGAELLGAVERACREAGVLCLMVETGSEGHPARRLYFRAGFEEGDRALLHRPLGPALHER
jgi:GNAT superfamily N-acetyltransferase